MESFSHIVTIMLKKITAVCIILVLPGIVIFAGSQHNEKQTVGRFGRT